MKSKLQNKEQLFHKQIADYARFPEMNPGPVVRLDLSGKVILANKAARELFRNIELTGGNWFKICPDFTEEMWKQIFEAKESLSSESNVEERCIMFNYVLPEERDVVFAFGTDITERRIAERLLTEIARFPDMNPAPVLRFDLDGKILLANSAAHDIFGIDLEGKCWRDICPGLRDNKVWKSIQDAATKPYCIEVHLNSKDFMFAHRSDSQNTLLFAFGADITQNKLTERLLRQSEKMATLGTLAAGITHELNNPAAAISRVSEQLQETFSNLEKLNLQLNKIKFSEEENEVLQIIEKRAREYALQPIRLGVMIRTDREIETENWFNDHNFNKAWKLALPLVEQDYNTQLLAEYYNLFKDNAFITVLQWCVCIYSVYSLMNTINQSSGRISEIVNAMKGYSYLDRGSVQFVDINKGIDNTLIILTNKLKTGITVIRNYAKDLPLIKAYGSELNQVWTNILDNAYDAMKGKGQITIRTRKDISNVIVEIEDNGLGIPQKIQSNIFDPFFTTKEPGKGTGLGLSTCYSIICERHKGKISVASQPGKTCFIISLPLKAL
jgi:signal transduction histidine kinase